MIVGPSNKVVVAFHLFRRAGRPPLVYHRGVKAISTLVAHSPEEYAKVRLGSGERILISTSQQGVRISKLWFGVLPVATIYGRSKKDMVALEKALMTIMTWPATQGPDICGRILSRVLKECEVRQRRSPAFQRGLRVALAVCKDPRSCSLTSIARTSPSANRTYPILYGAWFFFETMPSRPRCLHSARVLFLKASE